MASELEPDQKKKVSKGCFGPFLQFL